MVLFSSMLTTQFFQAILKISHSTVNILDAFVGRAILVFQRNILTATRTSDGRLPRNLGQCYAIFPAALWTGEVNVLFTDIEHKSYFKLH